MAQALNTNDEKSSLLFLLVDALAFVVRRFGLFLVVALPISAIAAAIAWLLDTQRPLVHWRAHWGWDFLFVLIYAMFLDRWIKEVLLDGATDCDETDDLRRSIVAPRFLVFAAALFVLAAALSVLPIAFPTDWLGDVGAVLGRVLPWLPHLVLWTLTFAFFALLLPSYAAAEPLSPRQALRLGRPVRSALVTLILGVALLSLLGQAATHWGLSHLPSKPWAGPAMEAARRLIDCLLLAFVGYVLAALFRQLADWQQPEPDDHPYRDLARARRKASSQRHAPK
jgi:hypothetical protein